MSNVRLTCIGRLDASVVIVATIGLVVAIVVTLIVSIVFANPSAIVATFSCRSLLIARPITFVNHVITLNMPC